MWFNIVDLSDNCSVISLQTQEAGLCYWPSFTGMEHCAPHTRAVHTATCLERNVAGRENVRVIMVYLFAVADEEFLKIRFMRLSKIKLKMLEVHTVDLHFQSFYASLQTGTMTIDPSSNSIPENIALIFTISILHVLCSPENANRQIKSTLGRASF